MECRSPSPSNPTHPFERNTWRSKRWVGLEGGRQAALHLDIPTSIYLDYIPIYILEKYFFGGLAQLVIGPWSFWGCGFEFRRRYLWSVFRIDFCTSISFVRTHTHTHSDRQTDRQTKLGKWFGENKPLGNLKVLPRGKNMKNTPATVTSKDLYGLWIKTYTQFMMFEILFFDYHYPWDLSRDEQK